MFTMPDHVSELEKIKEEDYKEWNKLVNWYVLMYYQDYSNEDIARALNISKENVGMRAHLLGERKKEEWQDPTGKTKALKIFCRWADDHFECILNKEGDK